MNVLKETYKVCRKYKWYWVLITVLGWAFVFLLTLFPQVPQLIVDKILQPVLGGEVGDSGANVFGFLLLDFEQGDYWGMFFTLAILFFVLMIAKYAVQYYRDHVINYTGVMMANQLRLHVFGKIITQNTIVMNRYTSGDLMSIANSDLEAVKELYAVHLPILMDQFVIIALSIFFLAQISILLMIIPLVIGVSTAIMTIFYVRSLRIRYNEIREKSILLNTCIQENINGVRIIRAYATEEVEKKKFREKNQNYRDSFVKQAYTVSRFHIGFGTLNQLVNLGSIIIGSILAIQGNISTGEFTTFLSYVFMINGPITSISNIMNAIQNSLIAGNRMFTFLHTNNAIVDGKNPHDIEPHPSLAMHDASVHLDDSEELKHINLEIPYGKKVGVMGKTGSGKTVLLKSLARFFETTHGSTMINGRDIKSYRVDDVRRQFSYVMQDVFLFSNTVDSNIALYDPDASREKVVECAKVAQAHKFIEKLSDGYETIVGERGIGLSGGQKQRISIARALLKDAPIIMLDDCTSALDMETEALIMAGLNEYYSDRTLIISSHRATSVMNCDEIIFLENGAIVERGTHEELLELGGKYAEVYLSQQSSRKEEIA